MFIKYLEKTLNDVKPHPSSGFHEVILQRSPVDLRDKPLDGYPILIFLSVSLNYFALFSFISFRVGKGKMLSGRLLFDPFATF
jgi:hypothetical protein